MESLVNYESDEDHETYDISETMAAGKSALSNSTMAARPDQSSLRRPNDETNYDDVTMDMSEDSNQSSGNTNSRGRSIERNKNSNSNDKNSSCNKSESNVSSKRTKSGSSSPRSHRNKKDSPHRDRNGREDKLSSNSDDRVRRRDHHTQSRDKGNREKDRHVREKDRDRNRDRERDRDGESRNNRSDRDRRRHRDDDRDRKRRDEGRRDSSYYDRKSSRRKTHSHSRSRSRSRSRDRLHVRSDKASQKIQLLGKLGIELNVPDSPINPVTLTGSAEQTKNPSGNSFELPKYYNPGVMNPAKYALQMQKRKLLWSKKSETKPEEASAAAGPSDNSASTSATSGGLASKWGNTRFAQDTDGKVASKFMRLMGIKDAVPPASAAAVVPSDDVIKKQEEMFSTMEQQYEVARTVTHTMRGMGLGFGRQF